MSFSINLAVTFLWFKCYISSKDITKGGDFLDEKLLKQLYERYARELYLYIFSFCHSHSMAEDILQETFLKAILSLSNQHTNMRAWLYTVARNLCLNLLRKERRMDFTNQIEDIADQSHHLENLLEGVIQKEKNALLYQALNRLPNIKREVLMLSYFSGLGQKEIAAILNITPENVRIIAYRAKHDLKRYLEEDGYDVS